MPYNEEQIIDMFNVNIKSLDRKLKLKKQRYRSYFKHIDNAN